jgi:cellulose synthase/poly-beta-1,6-N-acetylglucosamine synthase-like glycosyltransferase
MAARAASRWKQFGYEEETHRLARSELVPPVSLIADLEGLAMEPVEWLDVILSQRFPDYEVIVLYGEEQREEAERVADAFFLRGVDRVYRRVLGPPPPRGVLQSGDRRIVLVERKGPRGGASLNLAVDLCRFPLVAVLDGTVLLEDDALLCLTRPFMENRECAAAMGLELPVEMETHDRLPRRQVTRFSLMESLRIQLGYLAGAPYLGGPVTAYASMMLFRRDFLVELGGFDPDLPPPAAQMDVFLRGHMSARSGKAGFRPAFVIRPVARRDFPLTWGEHFAQARRFHLGVSMALRRSRNALFRRQYGRFGLMMLPFFRWFVHMAGILGFLFHLAVIVPFLLGRLSWPFLVAFLAGCLGLPSLAGVGSLDIARRRAGILRGRGVLLFAYAVLAQLWFRQATTLAAVVYPAFQAGNKGDERRSRGG